VNHDAEQERDQHLYTLEGDGEGEIEKGEWGGVWKAPERE